MILQISLKNGWQLIVFETRGNEYGLRYRLCLWSSNDKWQNIRDYRTLDFAIGSMLWMITEESKRGNKPIKRINRKAIREVQFSRRNVETTAWMKENILADALVNQE